MDRCDAMSDLHNKSTEGEAGRTMAGEDTRVRLLIAAYEAALAIASEVDLPFVLQRLVDLTREVVPARYAALGVADDKGTITEFVTSGISPEERAALGPLPQGHGLLGELIKTRQPLLVPDISADPRSIGFPPNHPPMRTLIGVPILLAGRPLGNLYLTERLDDQPFDESDLDTLQVLAAHAATAIDRAHLYRQLEEARQRAEEQRDQLRTILDNLPAGVLIQTGPTGAIELANAAAVQMVFGPTPPAAVLPLPGRDFQMLQADGTPLPHDQQPANRALRGEMVRNRQLVLEGWDGQRLPVLVQAAPLRDTHGAVTRAVVVLQDVARLREAEQLKDDFLALISHELRTPLTAIHGGAHLLANRGDSLDDESKLAIVDDIVGESDRLDRMLDNLLGLAAIQAGRLEPNTEPVLIAPLARRVAREMSKQTSQHTFVVDVPPGVPPMEADPGLLEQVLRNLYENAAKYSPDGGEIRTTAACYGETVAVHVADQGVGIAPEHIGQMFTRFRRPGAPPTLRGMGLGLYLSRHLVEAQGGTIDAASPGPGQGATFTVSLPVAWGWAAEHEPGAEG